jgi:hydrogenase maturation protease
VSTVVIGTGNEARHDDGAGLAVARQLRAAGIEAREARGDLSSLADLWHDADRVILVDAVRSGARPGTLHRFDALAAPLPAVFARASTHALGVAEAVELARALGRLPDTLIVYGIEGAEFGLGEGLSPEVTAAIGRAVAAITKDSEHAR